MKRFVTIYLSVAALFPAQMLLADDGERLLSVDHYVRVNSTAPAMGGRTAQVYAREVVLASTGLRQSGLGDRVILFIHGAGTPAEVSFDAGYQDYSWMAFLARAGFDVFGMDMEGYGRSTRPAPMNEPCNLSKDAQLTFVPALLSAPCEGTLKGPITTIGSDWNDIGAVVDRILALRHVQKVNLVAWSQGGPRAGGYAAQHPEKDGASRSGLWTDRPGNSARRVCRKRRVARHTVAYRIHRQLGSPGGLSRSVRSGRQRSNLEGNAGVRSGRRDLGYGRAPGAFSTVVGMESGNRCEDCDSDSDGFRTA
jgi:pimeloyl-ACP methyl ester carboxylesterase